MFPSQKLLHMAIAGLTLTIPISSFFLHTSLAQQQFHEHVDCKAFTTLIPLNTSQGFQRYNNNISTFKQLRLRSSRLNIPWANSPDSVAQTSPVWNSIASLICAFVQYEVNTPTFVAPSHQHHHKGPLKILSVYKEAREWMHLSHTCSCWLASPSFAWCYSNNTFHTFDSWFATYGWPSPLASHITCKTSRAMQLP